MLVMARSRNRPVAAGAKVCIAARYVLNVTAQFTLVGRKVERASGEQLEWDNVRRPNLERNQAEEWCGR